MSNNTLSAAVIEVIPNMSGFADELGRQLRKMDFASIGKEIGGGISQGIKQGLDLQPAANQMSGAMEAVATSLGGLVGDRLIDVIGRALKNPRLTAAFGGLKLSLGKVALAIAAVAAAVGVFALAWSLVSDRARPLIDLLQNQLAGAIDRVGLALGPLQSAWGDLSKALEPIFMPTLIGAFVALSATIRAAELAVVGAINVITGAVQKISGKVNLVIGLFTGNEEKMRLGGEQMMEGFLTGLMGVLPTVIYTTQGLVTTMTELFNELGERIFGAARMESFKESMNIIFKNLYASLPEPIQGITALISGIGDAAMGAVMSNERLRDAQYQHKIATEMYVSTLDVLRMSLDSVRDAEDALAGAQLDAEGAALAVERAQQRYSEVLENHCETSLEAREAAHNLDRANRNLENANNNAAQATINYEEAQRENIEASAAHRRSAAQLTSAQKEYRDATLEAERETSRFSNTMQSAGRSIVNGLLSGINSVASTIASRMSEIAQGALNAAKNVLGINSPSREFMKIGEGICEGLIQGLNDGLADVIKATCNMSDAVMDAFDVTPTVQLGLAGSVGGAGIALSDYDKIVRSMAGANSCSSCSGSGATMNFYTPVTGYHEVLAANRSIQRQVARGR